MNKKKLKEAFAYQIQVTRLLTEEDLEEDTGNLVVWNGVSFTPDGNYYSSGKEMQVGEKLLCSYVISDSSTPVPILFEESELESYDEVFNVVRIVDHVPVLTEKN